MSMRSDDVLVRQHHPEVQELLGVYALDAIDAAERRLVERHLRDCPACEAEVREHREVAAALAPTGSPPDGVWDAIAGSLEEVPPPLELAPVVPLAGRRPRSMTVLAAITAVAAVAAAVLGVRLVDQDRRLDRMQTAMAEDNVQRAAVVALANPTARTVELRAADTRAAARVALLPDGRGYLIADGLAGLATDRTYQLWALVDGERISAGTLGPQPNVAAFNANGPVAGFAITEEQASGVVASKNPPVLVGWFRPA
jgi:anti-sigma factor RsiW